jgi:hypothetical protein
MVRPVDCAVIGNLGNGSVDRGLPSCNLSPFSDVSVSIAAVVSNAANLRDDLPPASSWQKVPISIWSTIYTQELATGAP